MNSKKNGFVIKHKQTMNGSSNNYGRSSGPSQSKVKNGSENGRRNGKTKTNRSQCNSHASRKQEFEYALFARENSFRIESGECKERKLVKQRSESDIYPVKQRRDTDIYPVKQKSESDIFPVSDSLKSWYAMKSLSDDHSQGDVDVMCYNEKGQMIYRHFNNSCISSKNSLLEDISNSRKSKSKNGNGKSVNGQNGKGILRVNEKATQIDSSVIRKIIETEKNGTENDVEDFSISETVRYEPYIRLQGNIDVDDASSSNGTKTRVIRGEFKGTDRVAQNTENYKQKGDHFIHSKVRTADSEQSIDIHKHKQTGGNFRHSELDGMVDKEVENRAIQTPGMEYWVYPSNDQTSVSYRDGGKVKDISRSLSYDRQKTNNLYTERSYETEKQQNYEFKQNTNKTEHDIDYGNLDIMFKHVRNDQFKMVMMTDELNNREQPNWRVSEQEVESMRYVKAKSEKETDDNRYFKAKEVDSMRFVKAKSEKEMDDNRYFKDKEKVSQMEAKIYRLENKEEASYCFQTFFSFYNVKDTLWQGLTLGVRSLSLARGTVLCPWARHFTLTA